MPDRAWLFVSDSFFGLKHRGRMVAPALAEIQSRAWSAQRCLHVLLGAVLLTAAVLKGHQLLTEYRPGITWLTSRDLQILTVLSELALGLWLISGFYHRQVAGAALVYFVILAGVSGYLVTAGVECCGCLGRLPVSPWFTFCFNLTAICSLALCPPGQQNQRTIASHSNQATIFLAVFCFLGLYFLVATSEKPVVASAEDTNLGQFGEIVLLDVENWTGKRLPVLDLVDQGSRLGEGRWQVIFYHADCRKCEEVIRQANEKPPSKEEKIALIEVPAFNGTAVGPPPGTDPTMVRGRLSGERRWVIQTPQVLHLENGRVTRVLTGSEFAGSVR